MDKVFKIVVDTLCIIAIIVLAVYAVFRFTNQIEIFKVETGSMEDGIHAGDYILIHKTSNVKVGDVITFKKNNSFVTHRVIKKNGDSITTKGDANNVEDEDISTSDVVGKVIFKGGILNIIIDYKFAIVSFLLSFYLLTFYFDSRKKEIEEKEENEVLG